MMERKVIGGAASPVALCSHDGKPLLYDDATNAFASESVINIYIKEGLFFEAQHIPDAAIANDAYISIGFTTIRAIGAIFYTSIGGDAESYLYEGATITDNGVALTPTNLNRASQNLPAMTVYHTPTVSDVGTLRSRLYLPGGRGPQSSGDVFPGRYWILKPSTAYLFRLYNRAGVAERLQINLDWVEA